MTKKNSMYAQVSVTLTLTCKVGCWGDECTLGQFRKQAFRDADEQVNALLKNIPHGMKAKLTGVMLEAVAVGESDGTHRSDGQGGTVPAEKEKRDE